MKLDGKSDSTIFHQHHDERIISDHLEHRYQFERTNPSEALPVLEVSYSISENSDEDCKEQLALALGSKTWVSALIKDFEACYQYAYDRLELEKQLWEKRGTATANLAAAYNDLAAAYSM